MSNIIALIEEIPHSDLQAISDSSQLQNAYAQYASDESNMPGEIPAELFFPESWQDVAAFLAKCFKQDRKIIIAGAQTGLAGGALGRDCSAMISLQRLSYIKPISGEDSQLRLRVGAGVSLLEMNTYLEEENPSYWFPVDPTETTASFGGMAATSAAGARSYHYGSIRNWITWLRVVLADGTQLEISRGSVQFANGTLQLQNSTAKRELTLAVSLDVPSIKSTIGYQLQEEMDLIDIFIGSEGTLGVITDIEISLEQRPKEFLYVLQFFEQEMQAIDFVSSLDNSTELSPLAIESCDSYGLRLIEQSSARQHSRAIQSIKENHHAVVYVEFCGDSAEEIEATLMRYMELVEDSGVSVEDCIAGTEPKDLRDMKIFRHAIPERINSIIKLRKQEHPELHKLALDMAVPREKREQVYTLYKDTFSVAELEYTIFGHAGDAHFHVNILARNEFELTKAKELYQELAHKIVALGGVVAAEHGLGRLKHHLLEVQYSEKVLDAFRQVRDFFDPKNLLGTGVLVTRSGE